MSRTLEGVVKNHMAKRMSIDNRLKKLDKNIKQNNQLIRELKEELSAMNEGIRMILMNYMLDSIERETEK